MKLRVTGLYLRNKRRGDKTMAEMIHMSKVRQEVGRDSGTYVLIAALSHLRGVILGFAG